MCYNMHLKTRRMIPDTINQNTYILFLLTDLWLKKRKYGVDTTVKIFMGIL